MEAKSVGPIASVQTICVFTPSQNAGTEMQKLEYMKTEKDYKT